MGETYIKVKKEDTITQGVNLATNFVYRYVIMMLVTIMGIQTVKINMPVNFFDATYCFPFHMNF